MMMSPYCIQFDKRCTAQCYISNSLKTVLKNLFYHQENFWLSNKNTNSDDLSRLQKLNQNGITNFDILYGTNNSLHVDGGLITCGNPTKSEIIQTTLNNEDSDEDNVVCIGDKSYKILANLLASLGCCARLNQFFKCDISYGVVHALSVREGNLRDFSVKSVK